MMETNSKTLEKAHLRMNEHTKQCALSFFIKTEIPEYNLDLCEEIVIIRKSSDTIGSMLKHIKNVLLKVIVDKLKYSSKEQHNRLEKMKNIPVNLKMFEKHVGENMSLIKLLRIANSQDAFTLSVFSQRYIILCNTPLIQCIVLPKVLYVGFKIEPIKFEAMHTNIENSIFKWSKSPNNSDWKSCGSGYSYEITRSDASNYLKLTCIPKNEDNIEGPSFEIEGDVFVETEEIPRCPFHKRHELTKNELTGTEFRVVSYNILANRYACKGNNHSYCDSKFLSYNYRKHLILVELIGFNADIICLQEVDAYQHTWFWKQRIEQNNYDCVYNKKGNIIPEGMTCMFKKNRFRLLSSKQIVFGEVVSKWKIFHPIWEILLKNEIIKKEVLHLPTSIQVTVLQCKGNSKQVLIVANTHFYYHPDANHIRLLHAYMGATYISMVARDHPGSRVVFCGDFNSNPTKTVFSFMTQGRVYSQHSDCLKICSTGLPLLHELNLVSAYKNVKYTNYTPEFKDCLDYIFVDRKISIKRTIPLPDEQELSQFNGLPNEYCPSDHLPLVVDLEIK